MPTFKLKGFDDYIRRLEHLESYTHNHIGKAIYGGAELVADNVKRALRGIPVDNSKQVAYRSSINSIQKDGLIESFGIAPLRTDNDFINVKLGFDGYNNFTTFTYPDGQPNVMIARSLESGTSFMPKNPVISNACKEKRKDCIEKMKTILEKEIKDVMK